jgi:hypothetical protein
MVGPDDPNHNRHPGTLGAAQLEPSRPGSTKRRRELTSEAATLSADLVQRAGVEQNMRHLRPLQRLQRRHGCR